MNDKDKLQHVDNTFKHMCELFLVLILLIIGGFWLHQHHEIVSNKNTAHTDYVLANRAKQDRKNTTQASLKRQYDHTYPNITTIINSNRKNIQQGLTLAFSKSHSMADYNKNRPVITKDLGTQISNKILPIVKPTITQEFKKPQSLSERLTSSNISFGEFNKQSQEIPVEILAKYVTPSSSDINKKNMGVIKHGTIKPRTGYVLINGDITNQGHSIQINHEFNVLDDNQ